VPLLEVVSEPDLDSPLEARLYAERLHQIARYIGVADTEMEKAGMRFDGNISLRPEGQKELGTKVEVKNLNSFKFLEKALEYEVKRQTDLLEKGEKIVQETRGYIEDKDITISQRSKEESPDYRYFPEPDIPDVVLSPEFISEAEKSLVELPAAKIDRFMETYKLTYEEVYLLVSSHKTADFFERGVKDYAQLVGSEDSAKAAKPISNWLLNNVFAKLNQTGEKFEALKFEPADLAELVNLIDQGKLNQTTAKEVFNFMYETGDNPAKIVSDKGLEQISDSGELEKFVTEVLTANPKAVDDFKSGKEAVIGFLLGQVMAKARGKASPDKVREILLAELKK
jgi:aspartyl-tRNA(Asn)/glutamyl-tRNA(Gln) amidotransferase subunit B